MKLSDAALLLREYLAKYERMKEPSSLLLWATLIVDNPAEGEWTGRSTGRRIGGLSSEAGGSAPFSQRIMI